MRVQHALVILILLAGACAGPARAGLTPQQEVDLGRQLAREYEKSHPVSQDAALQARVDRVGQAVVEQVRPNIYPYQFTVIASPEINAFTYPGGFVFVFEGLVNLSPDDNALAFIVAHEVAHSAHRHISDRLDKVNLTALLSTLLSFKLGVDISGLATQLASLSFSRQDENDADATAVEYLWLAGFDTGGAETATKLLMALEKKGGNPPRFLRSHPPADHRLGRIQQKRAELAKRPKPAAEAAPVPEANLLALVGTLPAVTLAENPWFPLGVGNEWTYRVQGRAGPKTSYTVTVLGRVPVTGGTVYRAQVGLGPKTTAFHQWLTTSGEVWKRPSASASETPWQVECLTDPAAEGVEREGWRYTLVRTEPLNTPCGNFPEARVIRKERLGTDEAVELWFVRGVGLAKRVSVKTGVTELLTNYRIPASKPAEGTPPAAAGASAPPTTTEAPPAPGATGTGTETPPASPPAAAP